MNKYQERIFKIGKEAGARIVLPEIWDERIQEASRELNSLGFQVVFNEDFQNNTERLSCLLEIMQKKWSSPFLITSQSGKLG